MNRKTNIFYSQGNDSNFLTFDNYTEALTGDILATNQKLWPSRFLCLYVKELDGESIEDRETKKTEFINTFLVPYYENKLAFLRDNIQTSEDFNNILSLNYLLALIYYYAGIKAGKEYDNVYDVETDLAQNTYYTNNLTTDDIDLKYISDIVEQDYNGSYADIICTISTSYRYKPKMIFHEYSDIETYYESKPYKNEKTKLYGWENETNSNLLPYIQNTCLFDGNYTTEDEHIYDAYFVNSLLDTLEIEDYEGGNLKFKIIIPLFDSQYLNKISVNDQLVLNGQTNVPLGIYFTGKPVELEANDGIFNTNWSLLISMQFKAFPYSFGITHNFDDSDAIKDAYITFAEILSKQNTTITNFTKYNNQILSLQNKISQLESMLKNISTVKNIDDISLDLMKLKQNLTESISDIDNKIENLEQLVEANRLRWNVKNNV